MSQILLSSSSDTKDYDSNGDVITRGDMHAPYSQIYVMESACPHLGADRSHADIEECETGAVALCPWHRYDFDLETGKSETGLKACTYKVQVKADPKDNVDKVYMEAPDGGTGWKVVELRPVSEGESFYSIANEKQLMKANTEDEPVVPLENPPKTLMQWAVLILNTPNPSLKVERTKLAVHLFRTGKLSSIGHKSSSAPQPPDVPSRDDSYSRNIVDPAKSQEQAQQGRPCYMLSANIEQWAWDIMARFGPSHPDLPPAFFADFTKMALDESKHFSLLVSRLNALSPGTPYGSMPVHAGLWESATVTSKSLLSRLAIIHLVHEARGLMRQETVDVMEIIHADEVTHVTCWASLEEEVAGGGKVDPVQRFRAEVKKGWTGDIKGPFNVEARERAGLSPEFYQNLRGEMGLVPEAKLAKSYR
ncbi:hypothetical protein BKA70DRAFT_1373764 [Coprinopsis sp. MPI-PUGE-AT-0042]|nr:hypothetical protein BKA70DRAFT_1373764 [Coprinopsis sp. MPI-PUGE-AT-0042]